MIPRRPGDAAHRKKTGMETEQDPTNIQRSEKLEWSFTDDQLIIDGCRSLSLDFELGTQERKKNIESFCRCRPGEN
jgi:hypothetical protein